ncbi:MAG: hypothetical protein ACP5I4_05945 [Oceanipulchritudo sp.]
MTPESAYEHSEYWPFYVSLVESIDSNGMNLKAGARGVLIRMTGPDGALVDFGRHGLATLPVGKTDLLDRAQSIREGLETKEFPNFVYHLGPRLIVPTEGRPGFHDLSRLTARRYFLTVYTSAERHLMESIATVLDRLKEPLETGNVFILFMPVGEKDDFVFSRSLLDHGLEHPFVYSHLAEIYTDSLHHDVSELPLLVLNDADGKIILKEASIDASGLDRLQRALLELKATPVESAGPVTDGDPVP